MRRLLIGALLLALLSACAGPSERPQGVGTCGDAAVTAQSPIDLISPVVGPALPPLAISYSPGRGRLFNTGHNIQVDLSRRDTLWLGDTAYAAVQFHFHWPAEHRIGTEAYPAEIHVVHRRADGGLAVLGTLVIEGEHNAAWDSMWARLPSTGDTMRRELPSVSLQQLLSLPTRLEDEVIYRYCGSLTAEPYTEGVAWLVRTKLLSMSFTQLERLREVMHEYSREVQPLNDRWVRFRRPPSSPAPRSAGDTQTSAADSSG